MKIVLMFLVFLNLTACQFKKEDDGKKNYSMPDIAKETEDALAALDARRQREAEEEARRRAEEEERVRREREIEMEAKKSSLVLDPEFVLNFQPDPNTPMYLPFVVANIEAAVVNAEITAKSLDGESLPQDIFLTGSREVTTRQNGRFDVAVAVPFLINEQTMNGFEVTVTINNVKDNEGNLLSKNSRFIVNEGLYSAWHQGEASPLKDYAVVNEFLDPDFNGDLLSFTKAVIHAGGRTGSTDAERDLGMIKRNIEVISEDGEEIISLSGDTFFSYSFPGSAKIRTNGHRLGIAGHDWSGITLEIGVKPEIRATSTTQKPELIFAAWIPPAFENQMDSSEDPAFPASRGARGMEAATNQDCDRLIYAAVSDIRKFKLSRATCRDNFSQLDGQERTMLLVKKTSQAKVPVVPEVRSDFGRLVKIKDDHGRSIFQINREGTRCTGETCISVDYGPDWFDRKPDGTYKPTENFLNRVEGMYDPNQKGIYHGADALVVVRPENSPQLVGGVTTFSQDNSVIYGSAELWNREETKAWADGICGTELPKGIIEWASPAGVVSELLEPVLAEGEEFTGTTQPFANIVPDLYTITNVDASVQDERSAVSVSATTHTHFFDSNSPYRAGISGNDFRLNGDSEQSLRPLADEIEVFGKPGGDGFATPSLVAHITGGVDQSQFLSDYTRLAGAPGPHGFKIGRVLETGSFRVRFLAPGGGQEYPGYQILCDDQDPTCDLKKDENGFYVDFHGLDAELEAGRKVRLYYETHRVNAHYLANYTDYKAAKGHFELPRSFTMPRIYNPEKSSNKIGLASFSSFAGGGIRTGSNRAQLSSNYGFWNFRMSREPVYFSSIGGVLGRIGREISNAVKCPMGCPQVERTTRCAFPKQTERQFTATASLRCGDLFIDWANNQKIFPVKDNWVINNYQTQYFVTDTTWPDCAGDKRTNIKNCGHRERKGPWEEEHLNNDIEPYRSECVSRWLNHPWQDYQKSMLAACKRHPEFVEAERKRNEDLQNTAFVSKCVSENSKECENAVKSMVKIYDLFPVDRFISAVSEEKENLNRSRASGRSYVIDRENLFEASINQIKEHLTVIDNGREKIMQLHSEAESDWKDAHKKITDRDSVPGFDSKEEMDRSLEKYRQSIKTLEELQRPKIENLYCDYALTGKFRKFSRASLQNISLQPELEFVAETSLLHNYSYQANRVKRRIIVPDLSPVVPGKVSLKSEFKAVSGRIRTIVRSELRDCADIANRLIESGAPLPRQMFKENCH